MASEPGRPGAFARLGQLSILVKVARLGLGFVSTWLLARMLMTKADFGLYATALSASVLMALPGEAGMSQLAIREVVRRRVMRVGGGMKDLE